MIRFTSGFLLLASLAATVDAQESRRGILTPDMSGVIVTNGPTTLDVPQWKYPGDPPPVPMTPALQVFPPNGNAPVYTHEAMFNAAGTATWVNQNLGIEEVIVIDAFSSGNDLIPVDEEASPPRLDTSQRWVMLAFSVTSDSSAESGTYLEQMQSAATGPGPGAEIMGFYVDGSAPLPPEMFNEVRLEQSAEEFFDGAPGADAEISAFDAAMPLIVQNGGQLNDPIFPNNNVFYFSLTDAAATAIETGQTFAPGFLDIFLSQANIDGATIFKMWWDPATNAWSQVEIAVSSETLQLPVGADVDALAVHHMGQDPTVPNEGPQRMIFSTVLTNPLNPEPQLMLVTGLSTPSPIIVTELLGPNGGRVFDRARLDGPTSDIDSACTLDPGGDLMAPNSVHVGEPTEPYGIVPNLVPVAGAPMFDLFVGKNVQANELVIHLSGWPTDAGGAIQPWIDPTGVGLGLLPLLVIGVAPGTEKIEFSLPIVYANILEDIGFWASYGTPSTPAQPSYYTRIRI